MLCVIVVCAGMVKEILGAYKLQYHPEEDNSDKVLLYIYKYTPELRTPINRAPFPAPSIIASERRPSRLNAPIFYIFISTGAVLTDCVHRCLKLISLLRFDGSQ